MTFNFELPPSIEERLRSQAAVQGESLDSLLRQMVIDRYIESEAATGSISLNSPEEFNARLQEAINLHPCVTSIVDDSRESIYAGQGE